MKANLIAREYLTASTSSFSSRMVDGAQVVLR